MARVGAWRTGLMALFLMLGVQAASAQTAPGRDEEKRLEAARDKAQAQARKLRQDSAQINRDIVSLQQQLVALAARRDAYQQQLGETEDTLAALSRQETAILARLEARRAALMDFLAALERSGMEHPPALAVSPDDAIAAARAAMLLSQAAPQLRARADALAASLRDLDAVRRKARAEKARIAAQQKRLDESTVNLQSLLAQRRALERKVRKNAVDAERRAKVLASRASTLRELISQLEAAASRAAPRRKPVPGRPGQGTAALLPRHKPAAGAVPPAAPFVAPTGRFADSRGLLPLPVKGRIVRAFGQAEDAVHRSGIVIQARRAAQVTAPFDARILYSGLFRNLGRLLIMDVGGGYLIIIAGLERSYVVPDQFVLAGEPVGELANRSKPAPELFMELQKNNRSIDPAPWLANTQGGG